MTETRVPSSSSPFSHVRRILIVKPSALGDIVHSLPVLNALKKGFPRPKSTGSWPMACIPFWRGIP